MPQPHGGALVPGAGGGPQPGGGRPRNELKDKLKEIVRKNVGTVDDIVNGEPVHKIRVPLAVVLPHARCPKCGDKLEKGEGVRGDIEITARASASPRDRVYALDFAAKYSIGQKVELTSVSPEVVERLERQAEIIASRENWTSADLFDALSPVWSTDDPGA